MHPLRRPCVAIVLGLGALGIAACGSSDGGAPAGGAAGSASSTTVAKTTVATTTARATTAPRATIAASARVARAVRAVRTAAKRVRRGRPYDIETDRFRGRPVWEIKVASGRARPYELDVSANGRTVVRRTRERRVGDDVPKVLQARIGLARALRIADRRAAGRFDEAEIDRSRGRIVWTATFERSGGRETEVVIDARTGKVIRIERETERDD